MDGINFSRVTATAFYIFKGYWIGAAGLNTGWHETHAFLSKLLIDGSRDAGTLMRRWQNGEWQYRRLTHEEESERRAHHNW
jgi:hypothetical protein